MKTTIQLLLITTLVVISDGEVQSPQWLVEAIDSIEQRTRIAPWVYLLEYDGQ